MDLLQYTFFQHALLGSLLASIMCGLLGTYIVTRRIVFISGGLTHASFGGVGLGLYFGVSPLLTASLFSLLSALGIQHLSSRSLMRQDSAIAVFWTLGMALGIILTFLSDGYAQDLSTYLFGNILTINSSDLILMGVLTTLAVLFFAVFLRQIILIAFDRDFALSRGIKVTLMEHLLMGLIALAIVSTLRMVGIVLVLSLLTVPQMTAALYTDRFRSIIILSQASGFLCCLLGLMVSYFYNIPSGATIICCTITLYLLCRLERWMTRKALKAVAN